MVYIEFPGSLPSRHWPSLDLFDFNKMSPAYYLGCYPDCCCSAPRVGLDVLWVLPLHVALVPNGMFFSKAGVTQFVPPGCSCISVSSPSTLPNSLMPLSSKLLQNICTNEHSPGFLITPFSTHWYSPAPLMFSYHPALSPAATHIP